MSSLLEHPAVRIGRIRRKSCMISVHRYHPRGYLAHQYPKVDLAPPRILLRAHRPSARSQHPAATPAAIPAQQSYRPCGPLTLRYSGGPRQCEHGRTVSPRHHTSPTHACPDFTKRALGGPHRQCSEPLTRPGSPSPAFPAGSASSSATASTRASSASAGMGQQSASLPPSSGGEARQRASSMARERSCLYFQSLDSISGCCHGITDMCSRKRCVLPMPASA
jgi:hypothetical protein